MIPFVATPAQPAADAPTETGANSAENPDGGAEAAFLEALGQASKQDQKSPHLPLTVPVPPLDGHEGATQGPVASGWEPAGDGTLLGDGNSETNAAIDSAFETAIGLAPEALDGEAANVDLAQTPPELLGDEDPEGSPASGDHADGEPTETAEAPLDSTSIPESPHDEHLAEPARIASPAAEPVEASTRGAHVQAATGTATEPTTTTTTTTPTLAPLASGPTPASAQTGSASQNPGPPASPHPPQVDGDVRPIEEHPLPPPRTIASANSTIQIAGTPATIQQSNQGTASLAPVSASLSPSPPQPAADLTAPIPGGESPTPSIATLPLTTPIRDDLGDAEARITPAVMQTPVGETSAPPAPVRALSPTDRLQPSSAAMPPASEQLAQVIRPLRSINGVHELALRLQPAHLGEVHVEVVVNDDVVELRIVTASVEAREAMRSNTELLRGNLAAEGMQLDRFDVDSGDDSGAGDQTTERQQDGSSGPRQDTEWPSDAETTDAERRREAGHLTSQILTGPHRDGLDLDL